MFKSINPTINVINSMMILQSTEETLLIVVLLMIEIIVACLDYRGRRRSIKSTNLICKQLLLQLLQKIHPSTIDRLSLPVFVVCSVGGNVFIR
mmetsp:Transcript_45070/g.109597  ORF Transcript_45070/g.109597 Transcript_45070/m.109597 type:complete len:93 (+) Transcript_45070:1423-1701(+)